MKKKKIKGFSKKKMKFKNWMMIMFDDTELFEEDI